MENTTPEKAVAKAPKKAAPKTRRKDSSIMNEFQYTAAMKEEVEAAIASQTYKNMITPAVLTAICIFFTRREIILHKIPLAVLFALVALLCIGAIIYLLTSTSKKKKEALKAFKAAYGEDGYESKVTIEGGRIRSFINGKKDLDISVKAVNGTFDSERFFCFTLTEDRVLPLKKGSFIKGSVEMCKTVNPLRNQGSNH